MIYLFDAQVEIVSAKLNPDDLSECELTVKMLTTFGDGSGTIGHELTRELMRFTADGGLSEIIEAAQLKRGEANDKATG